MDKINQQYLGYKATPLLWGQHEVLGLKQFKVHALGNTFDMPGIEENLRLGKRVEHFVIEEFKQTTEIEILLTNEQISKQKITVGEIDCLLVKNQQPVHIEIVYKFYLYDPDLKTTELGRWIGPNRKDSLMNKLLKIKNKQFPLLFNEHTKPILNSLNLKAAQMDQRVFFKAQLFIPFGSSKIDYKLLNRECEKGFYIVFDQLDEFKDCLFFIPEKPDWLSEVKQDVLWIPFRNFKEKVGQQIVNKRAPLCWLRHPDGRLQKFFVVWW